MHEPDRSQPSGSVPVGSLQGLAELLPVGVFRASPTGQLQAMNGVFRRILSLADDVPPEQLQLTELFGPDIFDRAVGRTSAVTPLITRRRQRNAQLELTIVLSRDGQGLPCLEGVLAECEQRGLPRAATAEMVGKAPQETDRFESIGRKAGSVAHDIANLVTTISGYGSLLQKSLPEQDARHSDLDGIMVAAERCCHLARQLLDAGRGRMAAPPLLDVTATTEELMGVLQELVSTKGRLVWRRSTRALLVSIDRLQFEQVLLNLVANARDALTPGGTLQIEALVSSVLPGDERLPAGEYVRLSVSDEGQGMAEETVERIFEPFFSTKAPDRSTGLGLSTVMAIVEAHRGDIRVVSTPGHGSCFTVLLPRLS
ncbi:MAG: signal transduction histidine kinase [Pseudohongiellaceae bacterium]|jgi:signal transduction histidine kinase